jgi:hypothetical protein
MHYAFFILEEQLTTFFYGVKKKSEYVVANVRPDPESA